MQGASPVFLDSILPDHHTCVVPDEDSGEHERVRLEVMNGFIEPTFNLFLECKEECGSGSVGNTTCKWALVEDGLTIVCIT